MSKAKTDYFVHEMPLKVNPFISKQLSKRFEAARLLYNACLSECLKKIQLIRESKAWKQGQKIPKGQNNSALRRNFFQAAIKFYDFSEYSLHAYAKEIAKSCHLKDHLDSFLIQKQATKAFNSAHQYLIAKRGRPRFKPYLTLHSVEGKSNKSGIRFKENGQVVWNIKGGSKLSIPVIFDLKDKYGVEANALSSKLKYNRIIRKRIRGKTHWYLQIIVKGRPLIKSIHLSKDDSVGIDIGPSSIACVNSNESFLEPFCKELEPQEKRIKFLQKKLERSRRINNPNNYNLDGTINKGVKVWKSSHRYKKLKDELQEVYRKLKETRNKLHGTLVNRVFNLGKTVYLEKLSYKAFQKLFGKSIGKRAPGVFVEKLRSKAESAGYKVEEFSTYKTKLSQTCHCGAVKKKKLSLRWHSCPCGVVAQRDLYSAYLARFVKGDILDTSQAKNSWVDAEPLLRRAVSRLKELASSGNIFASFGIKTEPVAC